MRRTGRLALGALGLAALGGLAFAALRRDEGPAAPRFRTAPVERRTVVERVEAAGRLAARGPFEVAAPAAGRLAEVAVASGEAVAAGQVLARLDVEGLAFELRVERAAAVAAAGRAREAALALEGCRDRLAREERLGAEGRVSDVELAALRRACEEAEAARATAEAERQLAQARVAAAGDRLGRAEVVAPRAGVVLAAPERPGAWVSPERPLFTLAEPLDRLRVDAQVGEADAPSLRPGLPAHFEVEAYPGRRFDAEIVRVGVVAETIDGRVTYPVELVAPNPGGALLPGMSATVRFELGRDEDALAVREAALRFAPMDAAEAPPRSRVFRRVAHGVLTPVPVRTGRSDGRYVVVTPGEGAALAPGDELAIGYVDPNDAGGPSVRLGGGG